MTTPYCPTCGSVRVQKINEAAGVCAEPDCYTLKPWRQFTGHQSSIAEHVRAGGEQKERAPDYDEVSR